MSAADTGVRAYVAVGSNVEPERNVPAALELLMRKVRVTRSSTFYRTAPIGRPDQPAFCNGVWEISTSLSPRRLRLEVLRDIERRLGRTRSADRYAPRTIDLDLLLYGDRVADGPDGPLPHPDLARPFVRGPLMELTGELGGRGVPGPLASRLAELLAEAGAAGPIGEPLPGLTGRLKGALRDERRARERAGP